MPLLDLAPNGDRITPRPKIRGVVVTDATHPAIGSAREWAEVDVRQNVAIPAIDGAVLDANPVLKTTVAQIEKQFGEGAIMPLGADHGGPVAGIPTGSLSLDMALGGQGIPSGRVVEIFGPIKRRLESKVVHVNHCQGQ